MSYAVPWSTDVRTMGSPTVTFTPVSKASSFIGAWPWSWYMQTIASYRSWCTAWWNTVSAGCGPVASMPASRAARIAGAMCSRSSSPNSPCSPACGFSPQTAIRGDRHVASREGDGARGERSVDVRRDVDDGRFVEPEPDAVEPHVSGAAGVLGHATSLPRGPRGALRSLA